MEFLGCNGYPHQLKDAKKEFVVGDKYKVEWCRVGGWDHSVKFEGHPVAQNGVMFKLVADNGVIDDGPVLANARHMLSVLKRQWARLEALQ